MIYVVVVVYGLALFLIFMFSMGQLHLTVKYLQARRRNIPRTRSIETYPHVTVQLPLYNEKYVVERLIEGVCKLDYPLDKLEIQVLDDSTDETRRLAMDLVARYQKQGFDIQYIHRVDRQGYKAGALQHGLDQSKGEFLAVFDADFIPPTNFLKSTIPNFADGIGMVQTRWGHVNKSYSLLTRLQAFGLDAHFTVEQTGRHFAGSFINFNGTAGVWRKSCIEDAGGWSSDTLTEDLDLSYRAQIKGWKFEYLEHVVSPAELPVIMPAIKSQQFRWNKGAAETARKNLGKVMNLPVKKQVKWHAVMHLLNSSVFIPLLVASLLSIPMLYIKHNYPQFNVLFYVGSFFLLGFFSIGFFYWISVKQTARKSIRYFLLYFPLFLGVSMGLALHNTIAVMEGLLGKKTGFVRTPKFNIMSRFDKWTKNVYISKTIKFQTIIEGLLGLYFLFGIFYGIYVNDLGLLVFHVFLAFGYIAVFLFSIAPMRYASR